MIKNIAILLTGICVVSLLLGCEPEPAPPADSFASEVARLVEMRNTIRDGFAAGNHDKAHGPLHTVGHSLGLLSSLASSEDLSADQMTSLKTATDVLFEAFNQIDLTMHGKEGKTYDEVASEIDTALKTISDMAGVENDAVPAASNSKEGNDQKPEDVEAAAPPEPDGE